MNFNANINHSPEEYAAFTEWLTQTTLDSLKQAGSDPLKLRAAVQQFVTHATNANLDIEEIENILGVNEPCVMDLAMPSEEDEEIIVDAFEEFINI